MGLTEDAKLLGNMVAAPQLRAPDETEIFLDAMSMDELTSLWCVLQRVSRRDLTGGARGAYVYFDHLPHRKPDRALELALEVLRCETDKPTVMQLNDKFLPSLLYAHGDEVIERIEAEVEGNERLRWLLGGIQFGPDEVMMERINRIANMTAWRADDLAHRRPREALDCAALSLPELARAWVEQYSKSDRDRDDNLFAIMDYERELREEDPEKAIDLILEILKIETNPVLLSLLAAGPLEDVISMETIDRIEREAAADTRFRKLLGGIWYYGVRDELKARLDALIGDARW
ncbi:MAG: hypothetical protein HY852_10860 [Bradyrhizobium sp.]|uniref:DUF6869 domain-containing protein n=1 Tax=Bradyrhizobium sp. TaxID=376 RepID=UPI0025B8A14A|nr:hypothetical protein [Bradyrhizobium sp.]MBI5262301.1 hypothetical protein [Bradyrhizobium sp.]